jgi:hypothetical protein
MNGIYDDDEQHFSFDMIMHEPTLHQRTKEEKTTEEERNKRIERIPMSSRIKTKKKGKLILRKRRETGNYINLN